MKAKTYSREWGQVIVEECTRKEFVELASELVDYAEFADSLGIIVDSAMFILYKDGSTCTYHDGFGIEGKFRKTNIVWGEISNSATYQVFGKYTVNEDMVVEPEWLCER